MTWNIDRCSIVSCEEIDVDCTRKLTAKINDDYSIVLCYWENGEWTAEVWGPHALSLTGYWQSEEEAKREACAFAEAHLFEMGLDIRCPVGELPWRAVRFPERKRAAAEDAADAR